MDPINCKEEDREARADAGRLWNRRQRHSHQWGESHRWDKGLTAWKSQIAGQSKDELTDGLGRPPGQVTKEETQDPKCLENSMSKPTASKTEVNREMRKMCDVSMWLTCSVSSKLISQ